MNSRVWWKRNRGTPTSVGHTLWWAWQQTAVPGSKSFFYFYWKRYDWWKLRIFQATLIWSRFLCFPRSFYKRCSSVMLPPDQSTGSEGPVASFPGAGSTACAPEGRMRSAHHLTAPGALVPCPAGLPFRCHRCRARTFMQVSLRRASLLEGLEDTGQSVNQASLVGRGWGGERPQGWARPGGSAPPRTLTCWFPMVHLHALWPAAFPWCRFQLFSVRIPGWPISPHTLGVHVSSLEFSMTFSLSSLAPKVASSDIQSAIWYQQCELSTQTINWQEEELAHVSGESFQMLTAAWICIQTKQQDSKSCRSV